jgi:hypothetical protein
VGAVVVGMVDGLCHRHRPCHPAAAVRGSWKYAYQRKRQERRGFKCPAWMTLKLAQLSLLCPVCRPEVPPGGGGDAATPTAPRRVNRPPTGAGGEGYPRIWSDRD